MNIHGFRNLGCALRLEIVNSSNGQFFLYIQAFAERSVVNHYGLHHVPPITKKRHRVLRIRKMGI
jgi:hypothetical protein